MANKARSLFFSLLFFFVFAHGRSLEKNYTVENVDFSHATSFATYNLKTNYDDALGLSAWITLYPGLEELNPDPCLPPTWTWIKCNSAQRVIALNLRSRLLIGGLPDFSSMVALQTIDVSVNVLSGYIPSFLGTFPDLKELYLADNNFYGLIPDSLACNKNLKSTVDLYTGLYVSDKCKAVLNNNVPSPSVDTAGGFSTPAGASRTNKKKKSNLPVILGIIIPLFLIFWISFGIFMVYRHKAQQAAAIAQASNQGPSDSNNNIPAAAREKPMNI